jgi:hypothetical protein
VIEQLMQQLCIMTGSFARKRRHPQSALVRGTDGGSSGVRDQFDPTPMLDRPGGLWPSNRQRAVRKTFGDHWAQRRTSVSAQLRLTP